MLSASMLSGTHLTTQQSVYWLRSICETMCLNLIWHELAGPEGMHYATHTFVYTHVQDNRPWLGQCVNSTRLDYCTVGYCTRLSLTVCAQVGKL